KPSAAGCGQSSAPGSTRSAAQGKTPTSGDLATSTPGASLASSHPSATGGASADSADAKKSPGDLPGRACTYTNVTSRLSAATPYTIHHPRAEVTDDPKSTHPALRRPPLPRPWPAHHRLPRWRLSRLPAPPRSRRAKTLLAARPPPRD